MIEIQLSQMLVAMLTTRFTLQVPYLGAINNDG
jgi:hypothetical protein